MVKFTILWDDKKNIFVKTKDGVLTYENYPWYLVIDKKAAEDNRESLRDLLRVGVIDKFEVENEYVKVFCPYLNRKNLISQLKRQNILTYEDDLKPFQRFLVDEDVELEMDQSVLYFDIETSDLKKGINPGEEMILSIAAIGSDGKKYYYTHDSALASLRDEDPKNGEKEVLTKFTNLIKKYDILAGWNSEGFDLVAIVKRCDLHNLKFPCHVIERDDKDLGGLDNVRRMGKFRARPTGFNHMDLMQKMKEMHYRDTELIKKVRSFSLSAVSKVILGKDKVDLKGQSIYSLWRESPDLLKKYNMQDVQLLVDLDEKLSITKQKLIEHQVCCARINDYTSHGKIDIFALRGARKIGKRLPSRPDNYQADHVEGGRRDDDRGKEKGDYQGGFVFEPKTGLHKDVYIFDFQSLYPSIIKTFNVSIDSLAGPDFKGDVITMPTGTKFKRDEKGIIPSIIQDVLDQRNNIRHVIMKKLEKNSPEYMNWHYRQYAFKVLANSMYGIMGARFSRYFKRELAEGITLTGQHIIKHMWDWLSAKDFIPIYGDTDSLFLTRKDPIDTDKLVAEIKSHLDEYLTTNFNVKENQIIMDFKGMYPRFIAADKKKYVGINEEGEIEMTGLEAKKRDTLPKAEEWQRDLLDKLLLEDHDQDYFINWVNERRKIVVDRKLELKDITFQKRLSKEIEDYGKENKNGRKTPVPAHVRVAAWVKEQGGKQSDKINLFSQGAYIPYFVIESAKGIKAMHPDQFAGEYDIQYYESACLDASLRILTVVFPTVDWVFKGLATNQPKLI